MSSEGLCWTSRWSPTLERSGGEVIVASKMSDGPDSGLPPALEDRLSAFPVAAVRDEIDRLAAVAEEMNQVDTVLDGLGVDEEQKLQLMRIYLQALHARLNEAGKWSPPSADSGFGFVLRASPRGVPRQLLRVGRWLGSRLGDPARAWVSNRRVSWRRRRWRRLLVS